jgi:hypothetical protein
VTERGEHPPREGSHTSETGRRWRSARMDGLILSVRPFTVEGAGVVPLRGATTKDRELQTAPRRCAGLTTTCGTSHSIGLEAAVEGTVRETMEVPGGAGGAPPAHLLLVGHVHQHRIMWAQPASRRGNLSSTQKLKSSSGRLGSLLKAVQASSFGTGFHPTEGRATSWK